ncbi:hypothetical protein PoB_007710500 [Plakobranchus ocellatus]|uniref:Uncharacterized protein n=1 Tax=Plakobranchus ocellatus TaxID=259542 RepID=A0AAV4E317_9GAST|nr:hypothetical protein PoB_007710500 [Plakobranchus ocellatus]
MHFCQFRPPRQSRASRTLAQQQQQQATQCEIKELLWMERWEKKNLALTAEFANAASSLIRKPCYTISPEAVPGITHRAIHIVDHNGDASSGPGSRPEN